MRWSRIAGLLAGVAAAAGPVLAEPGVSARSLVIGQTIGLDGGGNDYGVAAMAGIRLAIDAANAAGGVHGRRIELRTLDDKGKAADAEKNARTLADGGEVFILFGSLEGGPSTAVAKVAEEKKIPLFGPMAGSPTLRRPYLSMVFPVRAEHRDEFRALMTWGRQTGLKTVGLLHADSDVGRQHLDNVKRIAQDLGMTVTYTLPFSGSLTDEQARAAAEAMAQAKPQLMLNHGSPSSYVKLIQAARAAGLKTTFMAVNSGSTQAAQALGPAAAGMVFAQVVPSPWERKHEISRDYQAAAKAAEKTSRFTTPLSYGALEGYLTGRALVQALEAAGPQPTRASFVSALESHPLVFDGIELHYAPGDHQGWKFVDLSIVSRDGRFVH